MWTTNANPPPSSGSFFKELALVAIVIAAQPYIRVRDWIRGRQAYARSMRR